VPKRYVGYSEFHHDAALTIINEDGVVEFASHAERYSKRKGDPLIPDSLWSFYNSETDTLLFHEDPENVKFKKEMINKNLWLGKVSPQSQSLCPLLNVGHDGYHMHHVSHCASAFFTRPWEDKESTVMVSIDGYGERQSAVIYDCDFNLLHEWEYPKSIGVVYTSATKALGLRPMEDEYVTMGLSSYGEVNAALHNELQKWYSSIPAINDEKLVDSIGSIGMKTISRLKNEIFKPALQRISREDFAATIQFFTEDKILSIMKLARKYGNKLVYAGGCAQNVIANTKIHDLFNEVHIAVSPTDAGCSLGTAAMAWHKETGGDRLTWSPYCGHNIDTDIDPKEVVDYLLEHKVCGLAHGKAEFGPRALGNRSLIADVRYDVKATVNDIKRRQQYRPFAPAVLEEYADMCFYGPKNEYMQYVSWAHDNWKFPSIMHVDGSSRVQVVKKDCESILRKVLEEYYERTGVPMLLNTSLNIRGFPMVNDIEDAKDFERTYKVKVFYE